MLKCLAIVGQGRVGRSLVLALRHAGTPVIALHGATKARELDVDGMIFAVPDAALAATAQRWDASVTARTPFLHCSGALQHSALGDVQHPTGVLHPLLSFADPRRRPNLEGGYFAVSGDRSAVRLARATVRLLRCRVLEGAEPGPLYHGAAAMVAGGAAALVMAGQSALETAGVSPRDGERALARLMRSVADNIERIGLPDALTGPARRGDKQVIEAHQHAFREAGLQHEYDLALGLITPVVRRLRK